GTADRNRSHWSTSKTPSYTKSVSWQHHQRLLQCGNEIYSAIKDLQSKAPDKNIVIFTHNHCLTYIAKDKRDATFKPDYLDGLVMHVEKGKVYLDGEFVNH
ncbi:hypothetical protein SNA15_03230, partial [Escherichia coli]|nr:hypothetical protein [Escherichia coli]